MIVFRPFKGEVILARITSATQDGINRMFMYTIIFNQIPELRS